MEDFIQTLRTRRDAAKKRLDEAQSDFDTWDAALQRELRSAQTQVVPSAPVSSNGNGHKKLSEEAERIVAIANATGRMKSDRFKKALLDAGGPIKASDLIARLKDDLSERYCYYLIATMKKSRELGETTDGKLYLRETP